MANETINWYPGHMKKATRMMEDSLRLVDAVVELRDARIPNSSRNPDVERIVGSKPRLIVLNRADQADAADQRQLTHAVVAHQLDQAQQAQDAPGGPPFLF